MKQFEMLQELMFEKIKNLEAEVEVLKIKIQLLEDQESNKKKDEEDKLQQEKVLTRSSARERVIEAINSNVEGAYATVANRLQGSGIIVHFEDRIVGSFRDDCEDPVYEEAYYKCKFYYSQTYDDNNPISWNTVNTADLNMGYEYFIFTMSITSESDVINCPNDIDAPNLYTFIFGKNDLMQLIKDSGKVPDKTGKYHFSFTIRVENGQEKAYQVRDKEVNVTNNLNNFNLITRLGELPF